MAAQSPLIEVSGEISDAAKTIATFLSEHGHSQPSLAPDAPLNFPQTDEKIELARSSIRDSVQRLLILVDGPKEFLQWELSGRMFDSAVLQWINRHNIASHVPMDAGISYSALAQAAGVKEQTLKRVLHYAILSGLFKEQSKGVVAHTAVSAVLVRYPPLRSWIDFLTLDMNNSATKLVDALEPGCHRSAFQMAYGTDKNHFEYIADKPDMLKRFAETMQVSADSGSFDVDHVVSGYDWRALGRATVVDVGGGKGHISLAIAAKAPDLTFIVQDRPEVIALGEAELSPEFKGRVQFQALDFWTSTPAADGDIYFLRMILHDYPDDLAIKLLKNVVSALKPGAKIVLCEGIMPEPGTVLTSLERKLRTMDLGMTAINGSIERDLQAWKTVFSSADERLKVNKVITPPGSAHSLIELELD